jgi:hypothetical protein
VLLSQSKQVSKTICDSQIHFTVITFYSVTLQSKQDQLTSLIDSKGRNLLVAAIQDRNLKAFHELLQLPFDMNHKTSSGEMAADIAWQNNNQQMLLELLEANSPFPTDFDESKCSEAVQKFTETTHDIHAAIRANRHAEVEEIVSRNVTLLRPVECIGCGNCHSIQKSQNLRHTG